VTAAHRVRWECPNGHAGVLGPRQPRRDSIVRYCLPCSERTGRLVERTAPALERQRSAAAARSADKAKRQRAAAARARARAAAAETARYTVDGLDLRAELARLCKLRTFKAPGAGPGRLARRTPELTVTHRRARPTYELAAADDWGWRIRMAIWPGMDTADARETLVHELVHLFVGRQEGNNAWHGPTFKRVMRAAFREAYGPDIVAVDNVYHGRHAAALRAREAEAHAG
jgi:SprT-like family protein